MSTGVGLALICAIWEAIVTTDFGYTFADIFGQPVVIGWAIGALMGDMTQGLVLGGSLELLYLGIIFAGGEVPADATSAALITIPIALSTGLTPEQATVLAVPFGLIGAMLWSVKGALFVIWPPRVEACIKKHDWRGVMLYSRVLPLIVSCLLFGLPVFFANLAAPSLVQAAIEAVPEAVINGLDVAGGILPAIGFAIAIILIGKPEILPFFFIGFFAVEYFDLSAIGVAIFGTAIAALYLYRDMNGQPVVENVEEEEEAKQHILDKRDVGRSWRDWWLYTEVPSSNDRLQGVSFMTGMAYALHKLYPNDDDYAAALERNSQFFNTEGTVGSLIVGMTLSMEEEKALGVEVPDELIYSLRTGMMGPLAGIGDSLMWGTTKTIFMSIATTFALAGNPIGAFIPFLWTIMTCFIGRYLYGLGYDLGRVAIMRILKSGIMNKIINAAGILGLMMMGALGASYVYIELLPEFVLENAADPVSLQGILDSIAPGLLPLGVIWLTYLFIKRHPNRYGSLVLIMIAASVVLSMLGIV